MAGAPVTFVYFIQDLGEPAVVRRVRMLTAGGAEVIPIGFRRSEAPVPTIAGVPTIDLGRSFDAHLGHRAYLIAKQVLGLRKFEALLRSADVIMARNLDMLFVAAAARKAYAPQARLVYECLDIHRLMLRKGPTSAALRALEGQLLQACSLYVVSSPGFVDQYFAPQYPRRPPSLLIENKVLEADGPEAEFAPVARTAGPPWRIGWFAQLRCRRSFDALKEIARRGNGMIEVVIRGRPMPHLLPNLEQEARDAPHVTYLGPYARADLADIYQDIHFMWGIEYYDAGGNSDWLLPNRIYESGYALTPVIADRNTQTAKWLAGHGVGVLVDDPVGELPSFLQALDDTAYDEMERRLNAIDPHSVICDRTECHETVDALATLGAPPN